MGREPGSSASCLVRLALSGLQKASMDDAGGNSRTLLGLPILDVSRGNEAVLRGQPVFSADGKHIHHRLLKQGLSQRQAVSSSTRLQLVLAF